VRYCRPIGADSDFSDRDIALAADDDQRTCNWEPFVNRFVPLPAGRARGIYQTLLANNEPRTDEENKEKGQEDCQGSDKHQRSLVTAKEVSKLLIHGR
jgi:hypothetical protein